MAEALHVQSVLEFFDCRFAINWESDSSVARAISERLGVGRIKHLEVKALWLQEKVKGNEVLPLKVDTKVNPADLNTKVHAVSRFEFLLDLMGIVDIPGKINEVTKTVHTGGVSVNKKTLALAVALGELMSSGRAELEPEMQCQSVVETASRPSWLMTAAVAVLVLAWLFGIVCGWKLSKWWTEWILDGSPRFLSVGTPASGGSERQKVDKSIQSQTTYTWKVSTPRFVPLQVYAHGCWSGELWNKDG